jgi:nitroreductase
MPSSIDPDASPAALADPPVTERQLAELLHKRRTVLPRRLGAPGPDRSEVEHILGAAAAAPDHGGLVPWRFVIVPPSRRGRLGDVFARSLAERDTAATAQERGMEREKAFEAPVLMLAVVRLGPDSEEIPDIERILSAGCALQNMLLTATVLGYGSALTTGKSLQSPALRTVFTLDAREQPLCFISLGTMVSYHAGPARPDIERYVSELGPAP